MDKQNRYLLVFGYLGWEVFDSKTQKTHSKGSREDMKALAQLLNEEDKQGQVA